MDKNNLELFKQALNEGLSEKIDSVVDRCTEEIVCSDRHKLAMQTIIYGKADTKKALSPKMKRVIAIIVAAALLITSCAAIFHNEIREVFEELFVSITFGECESKGNVIEEVYTLTYLPEGYYLTEKEERPLRINWKYTNENKNIIKFEQHTTDGSEFNVDSESGYSQINEIQEYDVYYRFTGKNNIYIWNNSKYLFHLTSDQKLSNKEIELIIKGMK